MLHHFALIHVAKLCRIFSLGCMMYFGVASCSAAWSVQWIDLLCMALCCTVLYSAVPFCAALC